MVDDRSDHGHGTDGDEPVESLEEPDLAAAPVLAADR